MANHQPTTMDVDAKAPVPGTPGAQAQASADEEVASLDRLLTRLALTEEAKLEKVLDKLLPLAISRLASPHEAARKKVMEMLTHMNKRVKASPALRLPFSTLMELYCSPEAQAAPLVFNFAMVYADMAFHRLPGAEKQAALPLLLQGVSTRPAQHQAMLLRCATEGMEGYGTERGITADEAALLPAKFKGLLSSTADVACWLAWCQTLLLLAPGTVQAGPAAPGALGAPPEASAGDAREASPGAGAAGAAVFPGLSPKQTKALLGGSTTPKADMLTSRLAAKKLACLNFNLALGIKEQVLYPLFLIAAIDSAEAVSRKGEELIKRRASAVNLEDASLIARLMALFQGTVSPAGVNPEDVVAPASPALKLKLLGAFLKSTTAANSFPNTLRVIFDSVYGMSATMRTKQLGMEFAVWVFKHAGDAQIRPMAPVILQALVRLLDQGEGQEQPDPPMLQLLGFTYQAVGQLSSRAPHLLRDSPDMARRLFSALGSTSSAATRTIIQDAVIQLGTAYKDSPEAVKTELEQLLLTSVSSPSEAVRFCAVQWAVRFFPPSHPTACYICLIAANDSKPEIREAGEKHIGQRERSSSTSSSSGHSAPSQASLIFATSSSQASSSSQQPDQQQQQELPGFSEMLALLLKHKPRLGAPVPAEGETSLVMPAGTYLASIRVLMRSWRQRRSERKAASGAGGQAGLPGPSLMGLLAEAQRGSPPPAAPGAAMEEDTGADGPQSSKEEQEGPLQLSLVLQHAFAREGTWALHAEAAASLLELAASSLQVAQSLGPRVPWLRSFLGHMDSAVRESTARLIALTLLISLAAPPPPAAAGAAAAGEGSSAPKAKPRAAGLQGAEPQTPALPAVVRSLVALCSVAPPKGAAVAAEGEASGKVDEEGEKSGAAAASAGEGKRAAASKGPAAPAKVETVQGSMLALGYILSLARALPEGSAVAAKVQEALPPGLQQEACLALAQQLHGDSAALLTSAVQAVGVLALPGALPLPPQSPPPPASPADSVDAPKEGAAAGVGAEAEGAGTRAGVVEALKGLLGHKDEKVLQKAALALGQLAYAEPETAVADAAVDAILSLSKSKNEATLFSSGTALAFAWAALDSPPFSLLGFLGGCHASLADMFSAEVTVSASSAAHATAQQGEQASGGAGAGEASAMQVDGAGPSAAAGAAAAASSDMQTGAAGGGPVGAVPAGAGAGAAPREALVARQQRIAARLLQGLVLSSSKDERCAGAVWLLCLLTFCGHSPEMQALLPHIQEGFSSLLGDPVELTQEVAAQGLSRVYRLGDASTRQQLVDALVGNLTGNVKKPAAKLLGDTELMTDEHVANSAASGSSSGGGGGARRGSDTGGRRRAEVPDSSNAPGTGLTTYKELCALATEMGQPDLIYRFMELANYHASMNSKRGAAFGVASILAEEAESALAPHLAQLLPKLLRMLYDPSKPLAEATAQIWRALLKDPKKAVDQHWDSIVEELLLHATGRMWRAREASCLALCDLLPSRKFAEVSKYLERAWVGGFRAADDIKETVRAAGEKLTRSLVSLSVRLCDPALTPPVDARASCDIVLPLLLSKGVSSSVAFVQHLSLSTVAKIAKSSGPAIKPHLPELVTAMLEGLSSLEEQSFNYVEMHAERAGLSTEKLESARVALSRDSPMWQTLEHCMPQIDDQAMAALLPSLKGLTRSGVGLNTRVGVAKFISALCSRHLGTSSSKPSSTPARPMAPAHAASLLKLLAAALYTEKSSAGRKAWAVACADVVRSSGSLAGVEKLATEACGKYMAAEGSGDRDTRLACALLLKELARGSADALAPVHSTVLPVLFLAREDEDAAVKALFEEAWEDAAGSTAAALALSGKDVSALLTLTLGTSSSWGRRLQSARAMAHMAQSLKGDLPQEQARALVDAVCLQLPGRLWEGKEELLVSLGSLCSAAAPVLLGLDAQPPGQGPYSAAVVGAVVAACERKKTVFRDAAYKTLEQLLVCFRPQRASLLPVAAAVLFSLPNAQEAAAPAGEASSEAAATVPAAPPREACLRCVEAALATPATASAAPSTSAAPAAAAAAAGQRGNSAPEPLPSELLLRLGPQIRELLGASLQEDKSWTVRLQALHACKPFLHQLVLSTSPGLSQESLDADWAAVESLAKPVASCLHDLKHSPVRLAATEAIREAAKLLAALKLTQGRDSPRALAVEDLFRTSLQAAHGSESNSTVKAAISECLSSLSAT